MKTAKMVYFVGSCYALTTRLSAEQVMRMLPKTFADAKPYS